MRQAGLWVSALIFASVAHAEGLVVSVPAATLPASLAPWAFYDDTLPVPAPINSWSDVRRYGVYQLVSMASGIFNSAVTDAAVSRQFKLEMDQASAAMEKYNQAGALIAIRVKETTDPVGNTFQAPLGQGASLIGVGSDPGAVCLANQCDNSDGWPPLEKGYRESDMNRPGF